MILTDADIRAHPLFLEAEALYRRVRQPGSGEVVNAVELSASPDGRSVVFAGSVNEELVGAPTTRVCRVDIATGALEILTAGPNVDRLPKYAPDGGRIAFLSDRSREGNFQLNLLDAGDGGLTEAPAVDGWIEYLHWSPDGSKILLGVAGHGADVSGGQGAITSKPVEGDRPSWVPSLDCGREEHRWRRAWVHDLGAGSLRPVSLPGVNVWEAVWASEEAILAVTSPAPGEGDWYDAVLQLISMDDGAARTVFRPADQLGWPAASPSGRTLAVVEAVCSDRWVVAGDLHLIDASSGDARRIATNGVDVTHLEWRSEHRLLIAGHRGFETVILMLDLRTDALEELWASSDLTSSGRYVSVTAIGAEGTCLFIAENFTEPPAIVRLEAGTLHQVRRFGGAAQQLGAAIAKVHQLRWTAPDGLEIQGWLLEPEGEGPHPLVMHVHGGPVWHFRQMWMGRQIPFQMLVERGYAIFLPNPRGSAGRGQDFTRQVLGDMGGADTDDLLTGLDHLVATGLADPTRIGVTGGSYGGFMTSWLIGRDQRFAAAVSVAPATNHVTEHLISNIPHFVQKFLDDDYTNLSGRYYSRSPILHAARVRTPTLHICGQLDRCTPPEEAVQFHSAMLEQGATSMLATYPEEGHGIRKLPAAIDYAARLVGWFEHFMPAGRTGT